jgi:hypothetical protein
VVIDFLGEAIESIRYNGDAELENGSISETSFEGGLVIAACVVLRRAD